MSVSIEINSFVNGIKNNDYNTIKEVYKICSPQIINMVMKNSGSEEDGKDVLQEALIIIYKKIQKPDFNLTSSFETYLYSVAKFVWLNKLKKKKVKVVTIDDKYKLISDEINEEDSIHAQNYRLFTLSIKKLSDECQKILKLYFDRNKGAEISKKMGYTLEYVKRKKYKCKERLIDIIKSSKDYMDNI